MSGVERDEGCAVWSGVEWRRLCSVEWRGRRGARLTARNWRVDRRRRRRDEDEEEDEFEATATANYASKANSLQYAKLCEKRNMYILRLGVWKWPGFRTAFDSSASKM